MKFSDALIDQVRSSVSIVGLIGGYVQLKKSGKDYAALCPFHSERTPSFMVSESKQIFKCFGCGAGGDVFKFVMLMENLNFPDAVQYLADRHGVALPKSTRTSEALDQEKTLLLEIMERAAHFFQQRLEEKAEALDYLKGRQITAETKAEFDLGYAPPGRQLLDELLEAGYSPAQLLACGVAGEGDSGRHYDKFRNRIMFPIRDLSGRTIAFGGRMLGQGMPKYLNSPDTRLYKKSRTLYPLHQTRNEIRRRDFAILVEGYFDCIVPYQFGVRNVVASLGTSLTEDQVQILGRYTRNVVVNYDPDTAGTAAAMRSIDLFLGHGFRVNVLSLPAGTDPDTFVRREGPKAYLEELKNSQPFLDFALSHFVRQQKDPSSPRGKQQVVSLILPYLARISSKIERAEYVSRVAVHLQVDERLLLAELGKMASRRERAPQLRLSPLLNQVTPAEINLLAAVFDPQWREAVLEQLEPELFAGLSTGKIFEMVFHLREEQQKPELIAVRDLLGDEEDRDLLESLGLRSSERPLSREVIRESVLALRRKQYQRLSRQLQARIDEEEKMETTSRRLDDLLQEKEALHRKIRELEKDLPAGGSL